jgi:pimeloyl-ACP methyl ester carboxylesterase
METTEIREFWFEFQGAKLFATESGGGPPIVLVHGGLATHESCRLFAAPLARRFRLITPDLRASGRSVFAGALSWHQLADDLAALLRQLCIDRAVIGGISFGAGIAIATALRHPSMAAALVLLHPAFAGADAGLTAAQRAAMQAMHTAGSRAPTEGPRVLMPLFERLPHDVRERARRIVATYDPASIATSTAFMASEAQPFACAAELAAIAAPVLIVPGTDPCHPAEIAEVYARHLPRCALCAVEPASFAGAIEGFIDRELAVPFDSTWPPPESPRRSKA